MSIVLAVSVPRLFYDAVDIHRDFKVFRVLIGRNEKQHLSSRKTQSLHSVNESHVTARCLVDETDHSFRYSPSVI